MTTQDEKRNYGPGPRLYSCSDRIPQDDQARKDAPMFRGLLGYFPAALFEVSVHSLESDRKHNPGSSTGPNWARGKSSDHWDCIVRHLVDAGGPGDQPQPGHCFDPSVDVAARKYHLTAIAWRALALLQEHCEAEGAKAGVSSKFPSTVEKIRSLMHPAQLLAIEAFKCEPVELGGAGE
jgi:hypothetical protein